MYKCLKCGAEFEEPRGVSSYDYIDTGIGMMAVADVGCCECPYCGGDFEEAEECEYCGEYFFSKDLIDGYCKECYWNYGINIPKFGEFEVNKIYTFTDCEDCRGTYCFNGEKIILLEDIEFKYTQEGYGNFCKEIKNMIFG